MMDMDEDTGFGEEIGFWVATSMLCTRWLCFPLISSGLNRLGLACTFVWCLACNVLIDFVIIFALGEHVLALLTCGVAVWFLSVLCSNG